VEFPNSSRGRVIRVLGIMVVATLLSGPVSSLAASAQPAASSTQPAPAPTPPQATVPPPPAQSLEAWRVIMSRVPVPKKGCFKSSYPSISWQEVPCTGAPPRPYPPARGSRPATVGNGNDCTASVSGSISSAVGSFDSVGDVTSETGTTFDPGPNCSNPVSNVPNTFSLQLNTNLFATSTCVGKSCQGWQQFIYSNSGVAFIQYWLINYGTACPGGWNTLGSDCWRNGDNAVSVPPQAIPNPALLRLTGRVESGGMDTILLSTADGDLSAANEDSVLDLARGWKVAEFNVFGDSCGSQANFNSGATLVVRTTVNDGTEDRPRVAEGFTGETNNLTLVRPCSAISGPSPAVVLTEKSGGSEPPPHQLALEPWLILLM
jgi:hypothetical protein